MCERVLLLLGATDVGSTHFRGWTDRTCGVSPPPSRMTVGASCSESGDLKSITAGPVREDSDV